MQNQDLTRVIVSRPTQLAPTAAFYLQASMIVSFLAGSSAPTPLYAIYQAEWGFSPITITAVFGIYAIGVLAALLTTGELSDHVGRKPVLFGALAAQTIAMWIFATAGGVPALVVARIVQGLATGAAASALGAGMLDIDRAKGTIANAVAPVTGTATGALGASLLVQFLPAPTQLVYLALAGVFAVQAVGVALMAETSSPKPGALRSLRPHVAVPAQTRRALLAVTPVLVALWAIVGFYGSLGPALVRTIARSRSIGLGGLALGVVAASAGVAVLALHHRAARALMRVGAIALIAGVAASLAATAAGSLALFFAGTLVVGVGFGAAFQGALRTTLPLAQPHERAGLLAVVYVISYLSMGVPAVLGGIGVVYGGSLVGAAYVYGTLVMLLSAIALALSLAQRE